MDKVTSAWAPQASQCVGPTRGAGGPLRRRPWFPRIGSDRHQGGRGLEVSPPPPWSALENPSYQFVGLLGYAGQLHPCRLLPGQLHPDGVHRPRRQSATRHNPHRPPRGRSSLPVSRGICLRRRRLSHDDWESREVEEMDFITEEESQPASGFLIPAILIGGWGLGGWGIGMAMGVGGLDHVCGCEPRSRVGAFWSMM